MTESSACAQESFALTRVFTTEGVHPFAEVEWKKSDAVILDAKGEEVFRQDGVEFPDFWSQQAINITASKYFRGHVGEEGREVSLKQVITRVVSTIVDWGIDQGYLGTNSRTLDDPAPNDPANVLFDELTHILLHQKASFNSPVWFNFGVEEHPQSSACFLNTVDDDMESIMALARNEVMIFKGGSGSGVNLSNIRASNEKLSRGGKASGPLSFMSGLDAFSGAIKSGGRTRRAAKMIILDDDHPDIMDFIRCKVREEEKARMLVAAGVDDAIDGEAYATVDYQNANNTVRVSDDFMNAVIDDLDWTTYQRTDGFAAWTRPAKEILEEIAKCAHVCGDPGIHFGTTINKMDTCPENGEIVASNPCSEHVWHNNSACNLSSINLLRFIDDQSFKIEDFIHTVRVLITAMEIIVDGSSYPTPEFQKVAHESRPLGLGYASLGGMLMRFGLPYDSPSGRKLAAAITSLMTAVAYERSAELAKIYGSPHKWYEGGNVEATARVIDHHAASHAMLRNGSENTDDRLRRLYEVGSWAWACAKKKVDNFGVRNSQLTLLAPTGTISFMMDCDTTGIEPVTALISAKALVGGGYMKMVSPCVEDALKSFGNSQADSYKIAKEVQEGSPINEHIKSPDHLKVFETALEEEGHAVVSPKGHLDMVAAVQPFLSGAISKCVTGDTLIVTEYGIVPIGHFYGGEDSDEFSPLRMLVASEGANEQTDNFYYGGEKEVIRVTLGDGRKIAGTPNHRVRVGSSLGFHWKSLEDIEIGDFVAIRLGASLWSETDADLSGFSPTPLYGNQKEVTVPKTMTKELALLLGYYTADGNKTRGNWTVTITNTNRDLLTRFSECFLSLFGVRGKIVTDKRNGVTAIRVSSKTIFEFFDYVGASGLASEKSIPWSILQSSAGVVRSFVRGLWLDGYVVSSGSVAISSASRELLEQLQIVFDNFGVRSVISRKFNKEYQRDYPVLSINGPSIARFSELIELDEPHKRDALLKLLSRDAKRASVSSDVVPCFRSELRAAITQAGVVGSYKPVFDERTVNLSRHTMLSAGKAMNIESIADLEKNGIHFVKVRSVENTIEEVYDFHVPGSNAFLGNSVVNHNTINMPNSVIVDDIVELYKDAWRSGVKAIAIYRDGSKSNQPVKASSSVVEVVDDQPVRHNLPDDRPALNHKFSVSGHDGYLTIGYYEDGRPGEVFLRMAKAGSVIAGFADGWALMTSLALQYGVPIEVIVEKFAHSRFEPSGFTTNPQIPIAKSILDYVARYLGQRFLEDQDEIQATDRPVFDTQLHKVSNSSSACRDCGGLMERSGSCYRCINCGSSDGCS